jgi:hypothetical protein
MRRASLGFVISGAAALIICLSGAGSAAPRPGTVTIVHALPGFTADVYVNHHLVLDGFRPTTATAPMRLDPGTYAVDLRAVGAPPNSKPALSAHLKVRPGSDTSIVAHLTEAGKPTISVFDNQMPRIPAGRSRLLVRDVAAGPDMLVELDGKTVPGVLTVGGERAIEAATGRHTIAILTAGSKVLIPAKHVQLEEGVAEVVYAMGSAKSHTLNLMVQSVHHLRSTPAGILTGSGDAAAEPGFPGWAIVLMLVGTASVLIAAAMLHRPTAA